MVNKLFVASTTRNKMPPEKSLGVGWGSLKFSFHSLLLLIMLFHQAFVLVLPRIIQIFDRAIVIPIKCGGRQHCLRRLLISEEHSITHYKLKDCLNLWQNEEATSDRHQWPSIRLPLWTPLHCYTANSNYRWRKNIRIQEKSVYTTKLFSGFKSFRIQISHFRFRIQSLRGHDQTEMFSLRIRPLVYKWQNQSGTETFRIHHESRTISSGVNLV